MIKVFLALMLLGILVVLFLIFFPIVQICGNSMYPTLKDKEVYLGMRVFNTSKLIVGGVYIYRPPYYSEEERFVVKRLHHIAGNRCYFLGDNPSDSYDSRYYGYVSCDHVVAKLLTRKEVFNSESEKAD